MKVSERTILDLLKRGLFGEAVTLDEPVDWAEIYTEAKVQTVLPVVYNALDKEELAQLTPEVKDKFKQTFFHFLLTNEQVLYEQSCVVQALKERDIPCVVLKGKGVAVHYPDPSLRVLGDIDILVPNERIRETVEVLQAMGYGRAEEGALHLALHKESVIVEVHKKPINLSFNENQEIEKAVEAYFADIFDKRQWVEELPVPADHHFAMVLIVHKLEHFLNGELGLRQLCDWARFVKMRMTPELWGMLLPSLERFGLFTFTKVMTRACIEYLGLPSACAEWALDCDENLAKEVIELILECGNFGTKQANSYGQRLFVDAHSKNRISSFFKVLFTTCKTHWTPCAKHPILLPIAPFVVYFKYLKMRIRGARKKLKLKSVYERAGTRQKLYRELKPFIPEQTEGK